jgi:uncharacterized delta-60 repeat protein
MSNNRNSYWLKKAQAYLTIFLFLGFLVSLPGQTVSAQKSAQSTSIVPEVSAPPVTPAFIDDTFAPALSAAPALGGITRTLVQPDGKILVAGPINLVNGTIKNGIARFNSDGTLDASFNTKSGANAPVTSMGLQSDGKIIISGTFTLFAGQTVGSIARLNPDGSFDASFNLAGMYSTPGVSAGGITDLTVAPNNKIYIGGSFTSYNGTSIPRFARLNPNGDLDTSFVTGTGPNSSIQTMALQADGKILITGFFATYNTIASKSLARINTDGSFDSTFVVGTGLNNTARDFVIQPDGKIIIGGQITTYNSVAKNGIFRLNADGSDDTSFSVSGTGASVFSIVRQSDGKLVVGGNFTGIGGTVRQSIARLNTDGTFDASFDAGAGLSASTLINELAQQADGSIVMVGNFTSYNGTSRSGIARTNANGTLDATLAPTATQAGFILAMYHQTDGKVLIGGQFTAVNGTPRSNVARLNADGSLDASFNPGTGAVGGIVESFAVQTDGKVIVGGEFTTFNGTASKTIVRLNADGTLDTSFVVGTGTDGGVLTLALQADGKILVGGVFTTYNSVAGNNLVRLNTDGSRDTTLVTGTGPNSTVHKIVVQADGKILVGGDFATYNAAAKTRLMRINADGSVDAAFNPTIVGGVNDFVLQADGKIAMVGAFTTVNTITRNRIARLNADGSLDTSFDPGTGFAGGSPIAICALPDGKFLVGGQFTSANGLTKNRLVRVRANGSFDNKFLSGLGPTGPSSSAVRAIIAHNGKYLIGGDFLNYNTSARTGLVLMSNTNKVPVDFDGDGISDISIVRQYGGVGPWTWWIKYSSNNAVSTFDFGIFGVDQMNPLDFDGDGRADIAIWRAVNGAGGPNGYWINSSSTNQVKFVPYGSDGDASVAADYDGDGKDDMAVWRVPSDLQGVGQATWIYRGSLNNPNGNLTYVNFGMRYGTTAADQVDKPVVGDWDGDGRSDFRVGRVVDTTVVLQNQPAVYYTLTAAGQFYWEYFGLKNDRYLPGDYDGDGKDDFALVRKYNIGSNPPTPIEWYIRYSSGIPDLNTKWGSGGVDQFGPSDYDGDGITDITIYRRGGENSYYILRSSDQTSMVIQWGNGDGPGGPGSDLPIQWYKSF